MKLLLSIVLAFLCSTTIYGCGKNELLTEEYHDKESWEGTHKAELKDNGKALINPMMGWTMHFYSNLLTNYGSKLNPEDVIEDFPGVSTVYLRIPWSFVEPEEGKFNWEVLDTPAQRWIQAGRKVAFRITATENWMRSGTPQWVFNAGAVGYEVDGYIEPDYNDPVFLEKAEKFVAKMAERYDNNPNVSFVDIGLFGMWGEGHTVMTSPRHGHSWGFDVQKKFVDMYVKYFKHTQIVISDDFAGPYSKGVHFEIIDYALSKGVTLRDDSILVEAAPHHWYHSGMAQLFWPTMPVVLEHEHYENSKQKGAWDKELFLKSIEEYHASYMSIHTWPRLLLEENRDVIDRINLRLGYRLQAPEIEWPRRIVKSQDFTITSKWKNAGVAPCYPGGYPCFTIKNSKGGIVSVLVDESFNVRNMEVGEPDQAKEYTLNSVFKVAQKFTDSKGTYYRTCKPGKYELYISVGQADGTPVFELPYDDNDGHKRYKLGTIIITE